jgi:hypothetical protein
VQCPVTPGGKGCLQAGVQAPGVCARSPGLSGSRGDTGPGSQEEGACVRNGVGVPGHWPTLPGSNAVCKAEMSPEGQVREAGGGERWADGHVGAAPGGGASPRRSYAAATVSGSPARSSATRGGQSRLRGDVPCDRVVGATLRKETQGVQVNGARKRPASRSRGETPPSPGGRGSCGLRRSGEVAGLADGFHAPKKSKKAGSGGVADFPALDDFNPYGVLQSLGFEDEVGPAGGMQDVEMDVEAGAYGTGDFLGSGVCMLSGGVRGCAVLCCRRSSRVG